MSASSLRQPAISVLVNGTALPGVIEASVHANNHYAADRFRLRVSLSASGTAIWSQSTLLVQLALGVDGISSTLIEGEADRVEIDPVSGVVSLEGRDLAARLIEARTQETFANRTSSEIATLLAGRHGLSAAVTPTMTPVGRYYQSEHDRITLDQFSSATTEWDLLIFLAQHEGYDVWLQGSTLYFAAPTLASAIPQVLTPADCIDLRLERSLTLAGDIEVVVKSWNSRQQAAFVQSARSGSSSTPQQYVYVRPNLTPQDALQLAQRILSDLTRHERVVTATLPGELSLTPRSLLALSGSGTDFDQVYYVAEIDREISAERGFVQHVTAKNSSPARATTVPADVAGS